MKADNDEKRVADLLGIRYDTDEGLLISPDHRGLKKALERTPLARTDLKGLLLQIDGVAETGHPRRFGDLRKRAVVIDDDALKAMGVEIYEREPERQQDIRLNRDERAENQDDQAKMRED